MIPARRAGAAAIVLIAFAAPACSDTLSQADCEKYRDRLRAWATRDGKPEQKGAADEFMKACPGTVIPRRAHGCIDKAGDEKAFFQCLE